MELGSYTLFATHFFEICRLQAVYSGFRNMHLEVIDEASTSAAATASREARIRYSVQHVTSLPVLLEKAHSRYGIKAAEELGLPQTLLKRARSMASQIDKRLEVSIPYGSAEGARGSSSKEGGMWFSCSING